MLVSCSVDVSGTAEVRTEVGSGVEELGRLHVVCRRLLGRRKKRGSSGDADDDVEGILPLVLATAGDAA